MGTGPVYSRTLRGKGERLPVNGPVPQLMLEGTVAKRLDSVYRPGVRSSDWVKVKRKGAISLGRSPARRSGFAETRRSVSVRQTRLDDRHGGQCVAGVVCQRCGSKSSIRLAGWVGRRSRTSFRYA